VPMRLSVQASLRLNHAIHQGNHRLDRPLHISAASGTFAPNTVRTWTDQTCQDGPHVS
jgi:hypothetical protein